MSAPQPFSNTPAAGHAASTNSNSSTNAEVAMIMGDAVSETESDTSSIQGETSSESHMMPPSPAAREQLTKRIESLLQENRVLKVELDTYKLRVKNLSEENRGLRQASVLIQAKAEQEEEFISNTLLKKIQELKKEKETLALNYEQEEECLTNDLSKKLFQLRGEKAELAQTLQKEQESLVNRLMRKISKLEAETVAKQSTLDQLRREKVELENTLEQEQESLVNRLWKRMERLEQEKRFLQEKLDMPLSAPPSPMDVSGGSSPHPNAVQAHAPHQTPPYKQFGGVSGSAALSSRTRQQLMANPANILEGEDTVDLIRHVQTLRQEVVRLKQQLNAAEDDRSGRMTQLSSEERQIRDENLRLRRKLELEIERRTELCRHLSESESSLEIEDERHFNELSSHRQIPPPPASAATRSRAISSPIAFNQQNAPRPVSPTMGNLNVNVSMSSSAVMSHQPQMSPLSRCGQCGTLLPSPALMHQSMGAHSLAHAQGQPSPATAAMMSSYPSNVPGAYRAKSAGQTSSRPQQQTQDTGTAQSGNNTAAGPNTLLCQGTQQNSQQFVRPANPPSAPPPSYKAGSPSPAPQQRSKTPDAKSGDR